MLKRRGETLQVASKPLGLTRFGFKKPSPPSQPEDVWTRHLKPLNLYTPYKPWEFYDRILNPGPYKFPKIQHFFQEASVLFR